MITPTFRFERELRARGYQMIAGVDEVGCGALAGPVVAAAVVLSVNSRLGLIRDSKLLSAKQRTRFLPKLLTRLVGHGIGQAEATEVDALGLRRATFVAMRRALAALVTQCAVDYVFVDAWKIPELAIPQQGIIRGDRLVKSIAAASIVAKVHRDALMCELAKQHPQYGFEAHKGYATETHRGALKRFGPCSAHRQSVAPVRADKVRP